MQTVHILIVEDESIVAKDIQKTLESLGYSVSSIASSGEEAIRKTEELHPDLVLMDIHLKGEMDGIEAASQIHNRFGKPVVYLTALADESTLQRAKVTEPFGYIVKPFQVKELHTAVEVALYRHKIDSALKSSEEKYKDLYDNAPDGYFSIDIEGKITEVNKTWLHMFGYSKEEIIGTDVRKIIDQKDLKRFEEEYSKLIEAGSIANFEYNSPKKGGGFLPVLMNASAIYGKKGSYAKSRVIVRDISSLKKLEREKDILSEKLEEATKKLPLTENEKNVFYGIIRYPLLNDIELSRKFRIKRSTITAIKNKLRKEKLYSTYRVPKFSSLGCELLTVIYAKLDPMTQYKSGKFGIFRETAAIPEQVLFLATNRELMGICISENLTSFKKHIDSLIRKYHESNLIENISLVYFPFEISKLEKFFDYGPFTAGILKLAVADEQKKPVKQKARNLTHNEKIILYALVKFADLNDSEIAEKTKLPRPSVSQTRRRLVKEGLLEVINIPDITQLKCELLSLSHMVFSSKVSAEDAKKSLDYLNKAPSSNFIAASDTEACIIGTYSDYTGYEAENHNSIKFFNENKIAVENRATNVFPVPQIQFQKLDFAPLLKKIFELDVDF